MSTFENSKSPIPCTWIIFYIDNFLFYSATTNLALFYQGNTIKLQDYNFLTLCSWKDYKHSHYPFSKAIGHSLCVCQSVWLFVSPNSSDLVVVDSSMKWR